ncbi:putative NADH-cytochrome B5 reductase [Talaromyces proteolyticus]|uniref:NADH-cytochrome b5 reductase n=1 Tax=Talaromyces proteolyticus TaxID=1131652 RepID=A0AAD4Q5A3_9EURO|nr:putative NADH-cytochrome B5 reductase [Talaromyces proteolyticus]KAH8703969.1 putative NADH-cytochrome B5 reductase [Talaromyces proteolyticus]
MAARMTLRQAGVSNVVIGLVAAGGLYTAYSYFQPSKKIFGAGLAGGLKLQQAEDVNHNTKRLRFSFPRQDDETGLTYVSSVLTVSWPNGSITPALRPYTPVSNLESPGSIDFLVKKYPEGKVSSHLHSLRPGDSLFFAFPIKAYTWEPNRYEHITLIAGGAGITPLYQLIQGILNNPADRTKMTLVFGVNTESDILLRDEFETYQKTFPDRIKVVYTVSNNSVKRSSFEFRNGRVTKELLKELLPPTSNDTKVFLCGPPAMEEALTGKRWGEGGILGELGFKKDQVFKF